MGTYGLLIITGSSLSLLPTRAMRGAWQQLCLERRQMTMPCFEHARDVGSVSLRGSISGFEPFGCHGKK